MRKYKLTSNTKTVLGTKVYQVQALRNIERHGVKKGDLGGWVESEDNLSQDGDAWVYGDARVFGNAWVYGDAIVSGDAWVFGDAEVYGNAGVSGDAMVYGNAKVCGNAKVYGDAEVYGNALVFGNAKVYGTAEVYGNARVSGDAEVYGNAEVSGGSWKTSPLYIQGSKFSLTNTKPGYIQIGCLTHTFAVWLRDYKKIGKEHNFTDKEIKEYYEYIKLFAKLGK